MRVWGLSSNFMEGWEGGLSGIWGHTVMGEIGIPGEWDCRRKAWDICRTALRPV